MNYRIFTFVLAFGSSLILGSGGEFPIEIYWVIITIATAPLWKTRGTHFGTLSTFFWILWLVTAMYSTVFSWDVRVSILALIRLVIGFIWFLRFTTIKDDELPQVRRGYTLMTLYMLLAMFTALIVAPVRSLLGPLNLIYSPAGHLPIVYIALPLLPILTNPIGWWISVLIILMSMSRAAWALLTVYALYSRKYAAVGIAIISILTLLWLQPKAFSEYLVKADIQDRFAYAKQAWSGFLSSPALGTGPGTFPLVSKRYALNPEDVSISSHNFLLQTLTEYGSLGLLAFTALIFLVMTHASRVDIRRPYLATLFVILGLGLVEQSMERLPVFLLFTTSLGILSVKSSKILSINSQIANFLLHGLLLGCVILWYILGAKYSRQPTEFTVLEMREYYQSAIVADPTNLSLEQGFLSLLRSDPVAACDEVRKFGEIPSLPCQNEPFGAILMSESFSSALDLLTPYQGKPKFLYMLGLAYLERKEYSTTRILWEKARDFAPEWGYYHVELASLSYYELHDSNLAIQILRNCLTMPQTKPGCEYYIDHLEELPGTGSLVVHIEAIPAIIDVP